MRHQLNFRLSILVLRKGTISLWYRQKDIIPPQKKNYLKMFVESLIKGNSLYYDCHDIYILWRHTINIVGWTY